MVLISMYLHGSKDSNWELGEKLGLNGEALSMFSHALSEVQVAAEVDENIGKVVPVAFIYNGKRYTLEVGE